MIFKNLVIPNKLFNSAKLDFECKDRTSTVCHRSELSAVVHWFEFIFKKKMILFLFGHNLDLLSGVKQWTTDMRGVFHWWNVGHCHHIIGGVSVFYIHDCFHHHRLSARVWRFSLRPSVFPEIHLFTGFLCTHMVLQQFINFHTVLDEQWMERNFADKVNLFCFFRRISATQWSVWLWRWRRWCTSDKSWSKLSWRSSSSTKKCTTLSRKER